MCGRYKRFGCYVDVAWLGIDCPRGREVLSAIYVPINIIQQPPVFCHFNHIIFKKFIYLLFFLK